MPERRAWYGIVALLLADFLGGATVYAGADGNQWKPAVTTFLLGLTIVALVTACILFAPLDEDERCN